MKLRSLPNRFPTSVPPLFALSDREVRTEEVGDAARAGDFEIENLADVATMDGV